MRRAIPFLAALLFLPLSAAGKPVKALPRQLHVFAPPVIPHEAQEGAACTDCHRTERTDGVPGIPHRVQGDCRGCHIYQASKAPWRESRYRAEKAPTVRKARAFPGAPPPVAHRVFMRENCLACHGKEPRPGAPKNPHPQRPACLSCHLASEPLK